ncbi:MAG: hypothetical protein KIH62_003845 [Candidatus Kerfeldbacteria bacterium]|nr:hypothetical protein [Candidatus Kerfeldbacteria bacterium]
MKTAFHGLYASYVATCALIMKHWKKFLPLILLPAVISFILKISTRLAIGNAFANMSSFASLLSIKNLNADVVLLLILCSVFIEILSVLCLIYMTTHHEEGTVFHSIEESLTYFWRFILMSLFIFFVSLLGLVVGYIPVWLLSIALAFIMGSDVAQLSGWLQYIANACSALAALFFVFAPYIMIEKNIPIIEALRKSIRIVRSHFLRTVVAFFLLSVLGLLLSYTLLYVPRIGSLISAFIIIPFSTIYAYVFYTSLTSSTVAPAEPTVPPTQTTSTPSTPA